MTSNDIVDVTHDIAEGVVNYGMSEIILFYISHDVFSIDQIINNSIKYFNFGEKANRPPPIKLNYVLRKNLGYSASEMINFVYISDF